MSTVLDEDDMLRSGFLDPGASKYLLGTTSSLSRSMTSPIYTNHFAEDANPWKTTNSFDPVVDIRQGLASHDVATDNILGAEVTAASVLVGIDLPEIYDTAYIRAGPIEDRVSLESLGKVVSLASIPPRIAEKILHTVVPAGALYVTRNEFNTALALVACAQKNMETSLQEVYQHRNDLPVPMLPKLNQFHIKRSSRQPMAGSATQSQPMDDPWKLMLTPPGVTENEHTVSDSIHHPSHHSKDGILSDTPTHVHTVHGRTQSMGVLSPPPSLHHHHPHQQHPNTYPTSQGRVGDVKSASFATHDVKPIAESLQWFQDLDVIQLTVAPEKEGFLFKHFNYVVESQQRNSIVLRRYSDFYWLWETLMKRYPFRLIPNLPPKKLGGLDTTFVERRRKGLSRFLHAIVRHPTLKKDKVVETFLTEPSELLAWRKANPPAVDEEFVCVDSDINTFEAYIPHDLEERLGKLEGVLPKMIEHCHSMCLSMDKMARLEEAHGMEFLRYSKTLNKMSEIESNCYVPDCHGCVQMVRGYDAVAKHMQKAGSILEEQAGSSSDGILEDLKQHRDILISFQDMLHRKPKLSANQMDSLGKKLIANQAKVNQHRGVPGLEAEVERLDTAIKNDRERMAWQQRRDVHIRYSISCELSFLHKQHSFMSLLYQNYTHEQLRFTRILVDNWKALQGLTCDIPEPEDFA
ncbi:hypothetical protein BDF14DRAFT_1962168 [Spinellus fusiger]|nr:hypothetical protein BDF14DRAFT_1962168 [Spinellus fusiger]